MTVYICCNYCFLFPNIKLKDQTKIIFHQRSCICTRTLDAENFIKKKKTFSLNVAQQSDIKFHYPPHPHRSGCVPEVDFEASHGTDDGDDGLDSVTVHYGLVLLTLLL